MLPSDAAFTITFSKPMQRASTEKAIYISPLFWGYPTYKWSGDKKLTIIPPEDLRPDATYNLTIGAGVVDNRNNTLGKSQSFAFSTGAAIDSGSIAGAIFSNAGPKVLYQIWAYLLNDSSSTDFWLDIPDYATQVDSTGGFIIENLGSGRYLVIAIDDKNGDLFWDPSADAIGLPSSIVSLLGQEDLRGLVFRPERRDTTLAEITRVTPINRNLLAIEFSQQVGKKQKLSLDSYVVKYADGDSVLGTGQVYLSEENKVMLETEAQNPGRIYRLVPVSLTTIWGVPFDTAGYRFEGVDIPDTVGPKLISAFPANGAATVYQDSVIELTFSERIHVLSFPEAVSVIADSTDTLQFIPIWTGPNVARLRFPARIPRELPIEIRLDPETISDIFRNPMSDSSLSLSFRLPPADTTGIVTAQLDSVTQSSIVGILTHLTNNEQVYQSAFDRRGQFELPAVMPGLYRFEYFEDADNDGEWSGGVVSPFASAEPFAFLADTVSVRSRWTSDIGTLRLPQAGR